MEVTRATALLIDGGGVSIGPPKRLLERAGMECVLADDESALHDFYLSRPDVLVMVGPDRASWQTLATIRKMNEVPAIAVFPAPTEAELHRARQLGADRCVPAGEDADLLDELEDLLGHTGGILRETEVLSDDFIELDLGCHRASALGTEVDLTPTEFRLLATFLRHPGQALSHSQLLSLVWDHRYQSKAEVKLYVSYLRRKLREAASVEPVETIRGIGYRYHPHKL